MNIPTPLQFFNMYPADSKVYLLNHLKAVQEACVVQNAHWQLDGDTFQLVIHFSQERIIFYPQFLDLQTGAPYYTQEFMPHVTCFIGWRPYLSNPVAVFSDKLGLKKWLLAQGFSVPPFSLDPETEIEDILVKTRHGSFGKAIHGPFKKTYQYPLEPEKGEYFEKFIRGTIVKLTYWNAIPVYAELQKMPTLIGDGQHTLLELAFQRATLRAREVDIWLLDEVLSYQGKTLQSIVASGESILADFRYESDLAECYSVQEIPLPHPIFVNKYFELEQLGQFFFSLICQLNIEPLLFSVDAIWGLDDRLWILEANANPTVPPCAYKHMLQPSQQL